MNRGGRSRGKRAARRTHEQRMIDAIREILGLRPLYAVDYADEPAVRVAQDRIDAEAALHGHMRGMPASIIDDWRID